MIRKSEYFSVLVAVIFFGTAVALEHVTDLKFLVVISRHGYRATAYTYKTDPYGESIWPGGFSSLTGRGTFQHYQLGQYLGRRYQGYVDPQKAVKQMYVRTTNFDRTIQSAMANMAGWFPPTQKDVWADPKKVPLAGLWRPFPVRLSDDPTLLGETDCPRIDKRPYRPDLQAIFDFIEVKHKDFLDYVRKESGEPEITVAVGLEKISDVLRCQKYAGFAYPPWVNDTVYDKIQYLDDLRFHIWVGGNGDTARARVNGGRILKTILSDFQAKIDGKGDPDKRKAYFYASHDNSIGGLLACLDLYDYALDGPIMHIPLYANTIIFELFNNNTVRVLHKNDTTEPNFAQKDPIVLKHAQCDTFCPLERLMELTPEYLPDDWKCECEDECDFNLPFKRPPKIPSSSQGRGSFSHQTLPRSFSSADKSRSKF